MLGAFATIDAFTWLSIVVKALVYATALMASGSVLVLLALPGLPRSETRRLAWIALACAVAAAVLSAARLPLRASFLMGGTWPGAFDPMMLSMVADSPLGAAVSLRLVGLGLICAVLLPGRLGRPIAAAGAAVVVASFVLRGHTLEEPRVFLGALITLHLAGLAFWIGALIPLYRITGQAFGADVAGVVQDFGRKALWTVGGLTLVGVLALWTMTGGKIDVLFSAYGQFFALKLVLFLALLGFAGWNKLRLTPDLLRDVPGAGAALRRSIRAEMILVALILTTTAAMTTLAAPRDGHEAAKAGHAVHVVYLVSNRNGDVAL